MSTIDWVTDMPRPGCASCRLRRLGQFQNGEPFAACARFDPSAFAVVPPILVAVGKWLDQTNPPKPDDPPCPGLEGK